MNIALCHFRVGETDGVSLEMEKWKLILERMGHNVCYLAGSEGNTKAYVIPEMHYKHPLNLKFIENAFVKLEDYSEEEFETAVMEMTDCAEKHLSEFIENYKIDMLIPNNILARGWNFPVAIAFDRVIKKYKLKCIAHHHDFYWERDKFEKAVFPFAEKCLDDYFPPKTTTMEHVVINRIAQDQLLERKDLKATVVPNVFDYDRETWGIDEYNKDFRKAIGICDNDILILQATRIVERKAIELAIDVVAEIQNYENLNRLYSNRLFDGRSFSKDNKIVFVLAGLHEFSSDYIKYLKEHGKNKNVEMLFINDIIEDVRCTKEGKKCYSLWDAFANSDLVTYPSIYEGWGNQFLETVFAKKPVVVFEYPVYLTDIKDSAFDIISLGATYKLGKNRLAVVDQNIIKYAAEESVNYLLDNDKKTKSVEKNFAIAKANFSYNALEQIIKLLMDKF